MSALDCYSFLFVGSDSSVIALVFVPLLLVYFIQTIYCTYTYRVLQQKYQQNFRRRHNVNDYKTV